MYLYKKNSESSLKGQLLNFPGETLYTLIQSYNHVSRHIRSVAFIGLKILSNMVVYDECTLH